ncbi:MAG: dihydroorotase [Halanaerobiaceae bacterium]
MRTLIKNAQIVDPINGYEEDGETRDILIEDGKFKDIITGSNHGKQNNISADKVVDVEGLILLPGLIDMHTHLREPGFEEKETIKTGCEAAAAGGFTTVACMPNTEPAIDNPATVQYIKSRAKEAVTRVLPIGSITRGREGKELSEIGFLAGAGVTALSDDGSPVMDSEVMRRAMEYAGDFDMTIIDHCEDRTLVKDGVMNEGYYSTLLGLKPIPAAAEEVIIARDIILAELTGTPLHIAHLSTAGGLMHLERARRKGLDVTAEVTPHHLVLTDEEVKGYNPNTKVNPPLRSREDVESLKEGLKKGSIDVIATDHAPHTYEDKLGEFNYASCGISGLETALAVIYTHLIEEDIIDWEKLVELMCVNPSRILGKEFSGISRGAPADLTVFDPGRKWTVNPAKFKSKGKNTPFAGWTLEGKPVMTAVDGKIVFDDRGGQNEIIY